MGHFNPPVPMYFAKRPLDGVRLKLRAGDAFPVQSKPFVRGLGVSYGVKDADSLPFDQLDYVEVVDVKSRSMATRIRDEGMNAKQAKALVNGDVRRAAA